MDLQIGGVVIVALILGIVEAAKEYGINGQWSKLLAFVLAGLFGGVALGLQDALIPVAYAVYIEYVVKVLAFALAANGWYDLSKKFLTQ